MRELHEILLGILAGVAQGISEWLPVSSKTILLLIFYAFGSSPSNAYVIGLFLNGATSLAAAIYFRRDFAEIVKGVYVKGHGRALLCFLLVSTFVTAVTAIPLAGAAANLLSRFGGFSMILIGLLFVLTGAISWMREKVGGKELNRTPTLLDAVIAGVAQGFSALPGISRSGVTILALLLLRHCPRSAIRLSFLMSIPATLGGSIYAYILSPATLNELSHFTAIPAIITSLIVSLVVISTLIRVSQRVKAHFFAAILAAISLLVGMGLI
ncbi:MAG: undecaprenyl-diphosphate phosphatase [Aigarchaeota archaeon]|nr:undecaprenyl-diphosphate phosphatase [Aigarchaeota archaeon]